MQFPSAFLSLEQFQDNRAAIDEFFSNPKLAEEFPEAKEEMANLVSMESYVEKLVNFDQRMRSARGISRGMALELKELVPDLQSFNPRAFTEEVSRIGLEPSLEAISGQLWAIIIAATAVIATMIYKFISWITGGSSSGGGGGGGGGSISVAKEGLKETSQNVKAQSKIVGDVSHIVSSTHLNDVTVQVPAVQSHGAIDRSHIPEALKTELKKKTKDTGQANNSQTDETVSIDVKIQRELEEIENSGLSKSDFPSNDSFALLIFSKDPKQIAVVADSFKIFGSVADDVTTQISDLKKLLAHVNSSDEAASDWKSLGDIEDKHDTFYRRGHTLGGDKTSSATNWSLTLTAATLSLSNIEIPKRFDDAMAIFDRNYESMAHADWEELTKIFQVLQDGEKAMESVKTHVVEFSKKAGGDITTDSGLVGQTLMNKMRKIRNEINALMVVYSKLTKIYADCSVMGYKLMKAYAANIARLMAFFHKYNLPNGEELQQVHDSIEENLVNYRANPVHQRFLSDAAWDQRQRA